VPLRAGTNRETPQTATTRQPRTAAQREAARRKRARRLARRRVAALACLIGALGALAVGVYLSIAPARSLSHEAKPPAPLVTASWPNKVAASHQPPKVTYARPVRLVIPKIDLDTAIDYVGLTPDGAMAAPSGRDTVGWYELGPRPGNRGSAVIDGHRGYADGRPAAFDKLPELARGDKLYVEDASGRLAPFVVRTTRLYARDANAAEVFAPTAGRHLNLITCTGSFDFAAGTHSQRLVVFADLAVPGQSSHGQ
jgi:LPXTG-site transpeptidase (sortase) family protein